MKITEKQKRFADYYIELGNATEAARKAGYSLKYINTNANKLLQNTTIKNYIDERLKQIEDDRIASAAEVLKYLTSVLRGEHTEEAELLGKRYGLFTDKVNIEGAVCLGFFIWS